MRVQAELHSDIALVFDECTPFHVTRTYTDRSTRSAPIAGSSGAWTGTRSTARRTSSSTGSCRAASTKTSARTLRA